MSRGPWRHGKAVVDGQLRYVSASQIVTAASCLAKWHWDKVAGKKQPPSKAAQLGTDEHAKLEEHLTTGRTNFDSIIIPGRQFIPEPGEGLLIEHDISDGSLTTPLPHRVLTVGYIDVLNGRGEYIDERGTLRSEPDTIEVLDWKFTGAPKYAETPQSIRTAIPMIAYAEWAARTYPAARYLRLSHCYFGTRKRVAFKVSAKLSRAEVATGWEKVRPIVDGMIESARQPDTNQVAYNTDACGAYGGCPHRSYCRGGKEDTLAAFFGPLPTTNQENTMSLLSLNLGATAAPEAQTEGPAVDPRVAEAVQVIQDAGLGHPTWTGDAAAAWCAAVGAPKQDVPGQGQFQHLSFNTIEQLLGTAAEIAQMVAQPSPPQYDDHTQVTTPPAPAPDLAQVLPPDAPASNPELAAVPLPGQEPQAPAVDPDAPTQVATAPAPSNLPTEAEVKKMKKPELQELALSLLADTPAPSPSPQPDSGAGGVRIFVDALPAGDFTDLTPYVDDHVAQLCTLGGVPDPRVAEGNNPLAFGKWRAMLEHRVRATPPAPGTYYLRTGNDFAVAVAEGLKQHVIARGVR